MPRTPNIPITGEYSSLFQNSLFQPKFRTEFENCKEESELESKKETSKKTITRLVTGTSSQSRNQETHNQEKELDIRPISPPAENSDKMATPYITRLTDFSGEKEETNVLNQFIRGLKSSILERICPVHPNSLSEAITLTRALELAEKEANHSQMVNIVMEENKTKTLEKRIMQLGKELSKKIESYFIPDPRRNTYQPPQKHSQEVKFRTEMCACHFCKRIRHLIIHTNNMPIFYHISKSRNLPVTVYNSQPELAFQVLKLAHQTNPNYQNYQQTYLNILENLIIRNNNSRNINRTENSSNKLSQTILPAVVTKDSSLAAIFLFELEKNEAMFSGAALDEKHPITAMYMKATINNTPIKLILDSRSTGSIIMLQLVNQLGFKVDRIITSQIITADGSTKLPHGKIDSFFFEINGIIISTKVLVINATQYQALTTQELLINYNGHQARILATCGHFQKPSTNQRPIFKFEENPALPAIKTYQLSWADDQRTGLPAIPIPKLECLVCKKKLLSMTVCNTTNKDPRNPTYYYFNCCNKEKYNYSERHKKWNEEPCLACREPLLKRLRGEMSFEAVFNKALKRLQHYSHDEDKLYNTAQAKPYTIESKEKIAQAIFLPLVKIGKFVPIKNCEKLLQTMRETFEELVYIPENTIIGYLKTELENALTPQEILNFPEITLYCELTSINWQQLLECYQFTTEKLAKLNIKTIDLD
ncbi:hypothetical protein G9A89_003844 [Geosiphon pyriformis]|nr:hypothetical protein G9A89_003844 [Geosiphon pyriformis]